MTTVPPIRPRIHSAPVINRFDIRQDGDSEKVSGPLFITPEAAEIERKAAAERAAAAEQKK